MSRFKSLPLTDQLAFQPQDPNSTDVFECVHPPQKMGNPLNIAYGGYALATACKSAYASVPSGYHLYSLLGNYLGPAYIDRPLRANVRTIRQTRTFATCQISVSQLRDDSEDRVCLVAIADFHVKEVASLLTYSKPPSQSYSHHKDLPAQDQVSQQLLDEGKITKKLLEAHAKTFGLMAGIFDQRPCPESVFAQNLFGMAKHVATTQDSLPLTERSTADWFRCLEPQSTPAENLTSLAFIIDSAIAFLPLSFSHMWFDNVSACSSLDFALRFFVSGDEVDLEKWHLREMKTSVGGEGRSYGESWVWDESGRAVACMSQQSILRPPPANAKAKGKL
jgi:acyl-CoA thioesterase II